MTLMGAGEMGFIAKTKKIERGEWMQTRNGIAFYPIDPRPEEINIFDISSALSKQCRYAGHCIRPYSVAEHCVHVSMASPHEYALTALMHDASEAYLVDIPRPLKRMMSQYREIEAKLEQVIADKYNLTYPFPKAVKDIDNRILSDERIQNMSKPPMPWNTDENLEPIGITLQYWSPARANEEFLDAFYRYGGVE
jgi:hypothetical protein